MKVLAVRLAVVAAVCLAPSAGAADFEWSSGGAVGTLPMGAVAPSWASYFIVMVHNGSGANVRLDELGFPCSGPSSSWGVWLGTARPADPNSPDYSGAFTPADTSGTGIPTIFSSVSVSASNIVVPDGTDFWFGYLNPGRAGINPYAGVTTYSWWGGAWDPDSSYGQTAVMQVTGTNVLPVELQTYTVD